MKYKSKLKKYCREFWKIENYELALADDFKGWVIHHRLEISLDEEEVHTPKSLDKLNMYWNRPYFELIFMKRNEHIALHNRSKGHYNEERRKNISIATKKAMSDPIIKSKCDKNRHKFPIGNYFGKVK